MKGIETLIATVLLVAFTVTIAGIMINWVTTFTKSTTETTGSQSNTMIVCNYGSISLRNLKFNSSTSLLQGGIENTGVITLGNITIRVIYTNSSEQSVKLCLVGTQSIECSASNLTLSSREYSSFNISVSSNYDRIMVTTNCSSVYDDVTSNEVT
jgi:hypothetical protein